MRFYIDFENVSCGGLKGVENLNESDIVVIYYSNNPNLNMDTVINLVRTKAKVKFQKLSDEIKNMNLKNALDIVILSDISRVINSQYNKGIIIISNDSGYDAIIKSYTADGKKIKRASSISLQPKKNTSEGVKINIKSVASVPIADQLPPQPKKSSSGGVKINEQGISALFKKELSSVSSHQQEIINMIKTSKTRFQLNIAIGKKFHADSGKIMKAIKPFIQHLPGK